MKLTGLFVYPVKSLRGISLDRAHVDALGLLHDRRFMVVDESGRFLSQRTLPRMAQVATAIAEQHLILSTEAGAEHRVPLCATGAPLTTVSVWGSHGLQAEDCGPEASEWLSEVLQTPCRLVRSGDAFDRAVSKAGYARPGDRVGFADAFPFLIAGEESLLDLNQRIEEGGGTPVPMNRFRPNFVFSGGDPFEEDRWERVRIGEMTFRSGGPCVRCIMTTTDQHTGQRGKEPLKTLARFRRDPEDATQVLFAQNLIHETKSGMLSLGDEVVPV